MRMWPVLLLFAVSCSLFTKQANRVTPQAATRTNTPPIQQKKEIVILRDELLLKKLQRPEVVILDVRTPEEFVNGHVVGAKNIDFLQDNFEAEINKLNPKKQYLLYCASGNRSGKALQYLLARRVKAEVLEPYDTLKAIGVPLEGLSP